MDATPIHQSHIVYGDVLFKIFDLMRTKTENNLLNSVSVDVHNVHKRCIHAHALVYNCESKSSAAQ